eukprot:174469-Pelagomonas_calceolata.AAC.4
MSGLDWASTKITKDGANASPVELVVATIMGSTELALAPSCCCLCASLIDYLGRSLALSLYLLRSETALEGKFF